MQRVFLSSTSKDLSAYRDRVRQSLQQLNVKDVAMEAFGARSNVPAAECERLVREESDIFVGIYAHRYGFVPDGSDISISEIEYATAAARADMPKLIYIVDEEQPWLPGFIDKGAQYDKLAAFKSTLMAKHICQFFFTPDDLAAKISADVGRVIIEKDLPVVGKDLPLPELWIDSLRSAPPETEDEWNQRRNAIADDSRGVHLVHTIRPSAKKGQDYDVSMYLYRSKQFDDPLDFSDVAFAEFFMGRHWGNKVFATQVNNGHIGIRTAAYGPFLCICQVTFNDGHMATLSRFIDFESRSGN